MDEEMLVSPTDVEEMQESKQPQITEQPKKKEEAFSQMNQKSFLIVVVLLTAIIALCGILTNFIPQGAYLRDENGMIINGTYAQGETKGIAVWRVITAPFRVFISEDAVTIIMISAFLLIMSGVFNLFEKTQGIRIIIQKTVEKFSTKKHLVVYVTAFIFMAFGSFFGMFEELVTLLPLIVVFMLSMGLDTLTGLGVCMLAACFGFSSAITNPFSVGIVAKLAGTYIVDGVWLRIVFFAIVFACVSTFLFLHVRKITKNPEKSLTYELDQKKRQSLNFSKYEETPEEQRIFKIYVIFFAVQLIVLLSVATIRAISGFAIPILAVSFLVGGLTCGMLVCKDKKSVFKHFGVGAVAMLPAVLLIALASSVKLIMSESGILDTIMFVAVRALADKSPYLCVVLIYFLILFLQIFIGSSSAKIMLIMPIILPIAQTLGISTSVVVLTYCMADGFTDVILPTNPVLLIGLSIANVSYGKWVKWTWLFQILMFALTLLVLFFAVQIGY